MTLLGAWCVVSPVALWAIWLGFQKTGVDGAQTVVYVGIQPPGPTFVEAEPTAGLPVAGTLVPTITLISSLTLLVVVASPPATILPSPSSMPTVPSYPTPTSVSLNEIYAAAFVSCAARYHGDKARSRVWAARATIERGLQTLMGCG